MLRGVLFFCFVTFADKNFLALYKCTDSYYYFYNNLYFRILIHSAKFNSRHSVSKRIDFSEDLLLWQQFRAGDKEAFSLLFHKYSDVLLKYGLTLGLDKDVVKDCVQELFIELWRYHTTIAEVKTVRLYLLTSFRGVVYRNRMAAKKWVNWQPGFEYRNEALQTESPEHTTIDVEGAAAKEQMLMQEVNKLPGRQREAVFLRFFQELSYEEITEVMSLNYQVVRNMIHRAIKTLRQRLDKLKYLVFFAASFLAAFLFG